MGLEKRKETGKWRFRLKQKGADGTTEDYRVTLEAGISDRAAKRIDTALTAALKFNDFRFLDGDSRRVCITLFRNQFPDIPLVVLSASESPHDIRSALEAGALGYIPKAASTTVMLTALRQVLAGDIYVPDCLGNGHGGLHTIAPADFESLQHSGLTARQFEVTRLLVQGFTNKNIGSMLSMSEGTVKVHIAAIFRAFNVSNRTEAVLEIQRLMQKS